MKLNSITLGLENCDTIDISADDIETLTITGIQKNYDYINRPTNTDHKVSASTSCDYFLLIVNKSGDNLYHPFGAEDEKPDSVFYRLQNFADIVSVTLNLNDGEPEEIYVPWDGDGCINTCERIEMKENGQLSIEIN